MARERGPARFWVLVPGPPARVRSSCLSAQNILAGSLPLLTQPWGRPRSWLGPRGGAPLAAPRAESPTLGKLAEVSLAPRSEARSGSLPVLALPTSSRRGRGRPTPRGLPDRPRTSSEGAETVGTAAAPGEPEGAGRLPSTLGRQRPARPGERGAAPSLRPRRHPPETFPKPSAPQKQNKE